MVKFLLKHPVHIQILRKENETVLCYVPLTKTFDSAAETKGNLFKQILVFLNYLQIIYHLHHHHRSSSDVHSVGKPIHY